MSVFTAHIQALIGAETIGPAEMEALFSELRGRVKGELRRRGLLLMPPSYLGFHAASWDDPDTFDDLVQDVYLSAFLGPLDALARHLKVLDNVDGMVFNNIRFHFNRIQRNHDPVGTRIFNTLHTAIERLRESGGILVTVGGDEFSGETVLSLPSSATAVPVATAPDSSPAALDRLAEIVGGWADDLMPELVTAMGPGQTKIYQRIGILVERLAEQGFAVFRFGDLLTPLKRETRRRWREAGLREDDTAFEKDSDGLVRLLKTTEPDTSFADREAFTGLVRCVSRGIDRLAETAKTRDYLHRLWTYLRDFAHDEREKLPGGRVLSELLNVPRERIGGLLEHLRPMFSVCFSSTFGKTTLEALREEIAPP